MTTVNKLLNTNQAVDYLRATHGYITTRASMETLRCRGGGAAYLKIRGKVFYTVPQLDQWIDVNSIEYAHTDCPAAAAPSNPR